MKFNLQRDIAYIVALGITALIVVLGLATPERFADGTGAVFGFLTDNFSWFYLISMFIFVVFSLGLALSKYGNIKLGDDDSKPEYSTFTWFTMMFIAGMGIGLVFWGVAEPLNHFVSFGMDEAAANEAMRVSFMHWGIHPWSGYAVIGMALAYFQFRKKSPGLISSIFLPILGEKGVRGPIGKTIDVLAIFATVGGVATSLGSGTLQINAGLNHLFGIPQGTLPIIIIVAIMASVYIWSAVSGINKGIKVLSKVNMWLALGLMTCVLIVGPVLVIVQIFTNTTGAYLSSFIQESFAINPFGDNSWLGGWTVFYWAWWVSWAPFVGTFIARISKGRTIKEFVLMVILAPSLFSMIWFSIFGGLGLNLDNTIIQSAIETTETALFVVFSQYPLGFLMSIVTVVLLLIFFITSADSAIYVLSMFSSEGSLNPGNTKKIIWGIIQAMLALVLLITGGLGALQTISIVAAFPFAIVMLLACYCMYKALSGERRGQVPQSFGPAVDDSE